MGPVKGPFNCRLLRGSCRSWPISLVFGCVELSVYSSSSDAGGYRIQSIVGHLKEKILENLTQFCSFFSRRPGGTVSFLKEDEP